MGQKLQFEIIKAADKPTAVASKLVIFQVEDDEYVFCPIRKRALKVTSAPEEKVRQVWLYNLRDSYGYSFDQMAVEVPVLVGSTIAKKKADIVVYTDTKRATARIFIEVKKPKRLDGVDQLKVYMNATGCRLGLWSNGSDAPVYLLRMEPSAGQEQPEWRELRNIPGKTEKLEDVDTPLTRADLNPVVDLLSVLRASENYIKAHEASSPFDEMFKLIFAKLFDEKQNLQNSNSRAQFRIGALEKASEAKVRVAQLFERAKTRWSGVFEASEEIALSDDSLAYCVSALQRSYLLRSAPDVLGDAFEVMVNPDMKGDKGQYFTPRHVIRMCVEVIDPNDQETVFDPACGSGGFLLSAMDHVFKKIDHARDDADAAIENKKDYASECVYGIDYDRRIAKVAKAYMLISGDGRSNIAVVDGLNEANLAKRREGQVCPRYRRQGTATAVRRHSHQPTICW